MEIKSTLTNRSDGKIFDLIYREDDPQKNLTGKVMQGVHGYCFLGDQMVIVYAESKGYWTPPGGGVEEGESFEEATVREVLEETNMEVSYHEFMGYQDIYESDRIVRQTRSFCWVKPLGDFVSDPDGDITEIKLINPGEIKKYFDWGQVGDRLIKKALAIKSKMERGANLS